MADIIDFSKAKESIGDHEYDDIKPIEQWDGDDWQSFWDIALEEISQRTGRDKWDLFADFMHELINAI